MCRVVVRKELGGRMDCLRYGDMLVKGNGREESEGLVIFWNLGFLVLLSVY